MTPPFLSYAQTGEDVLLWRALGEQTPGFYIDAGAADPSFLSVTRAFHERGWCGIDVEPLPEQAAKLRQARPRDIVVEAALSDVAGQATLYRVDLHGDTGLSTLDMAGAERFGAAQFGAVVQPLEVQVTTLATLCRAHAHREVHFLKIDVEGAEAAVLRGADFHATRPWIVLVEATKPLTPEPSAEWESLLLQAAYQFVWFDGLNRFYVAAERHAALARHFTVPPNPFDRYESYNPGHAAEREALDRLARDRLERIGALEAELEALRRAQPAVLPPAVLPPPVPPLPAVSPAITPLPGLLRVALGPLVRRARSALLGALPGEVASMRARQEAVLARLEQALAESAGPAMDAKLAQAIERALQALVTERDS